MITIIIINRIRLSGAEYQFWYVRQFSDIPEFDPGFIFGGPFLWGKNYTYTHFQKLSTERRILISGSQSEFKGMQFAAEVDGSMQIY